MSSMFGNHKKWEFCALGKTFKIIKKKKKKISNAQFNQLDFSFSIGKSLIYTHPWLSMIKWLNKEIKFCQIHKRDKTRQQFQLEKIKRKDEVGDDLLSLITFKTKLYPIITKWWSQLLGYEQNEISCVLGPVD